MLAELRDPVGNRVRGFAPHYILVSTGSVRFDGGYLLMQHFTGISAMKHYKMSLPAASFYFKKIC